jgi:monofunctional glycosyltransferase
MAMWKSKLLRAGALLLLCTVSLQLYFLARVALMVVLDPQSTSFQRSEAWRLLLRDGRIVWSQQWVDDERLSRHLKRAVIASEDANFTEHSGVEWDALEAAWEKNQRAQARAEKRNELLEKRDAARAARKGVPPAAAASRPREVPTVIGGSTIRQHLVLSGERSVLRKSQEFVITFMLEGLLDKPRILAIYLNNVEWGEGVFGAQAAARHYHRVDAAALSPGAASRLAVMLPAPKRFEKNPASGYVAGRAATIQARMAAVDAP